MNQNTMICRCPGCNANMEYSPAIKMMYCVYCGMQMPVQSGQAEERDALGGQSKEIDRQTVEQQADTAQETMKIRKREERERPVLEMQIYRCTSCGAELAVSDVEATSFCPYCGLSSVIKDRVDSILEPDYIIPFQITKEQAEGIAREKISKAIFVSDEVRNFEIEHLRGIYVPFWLYDIYYDDNLYMREMTNDHREYVYHHIAAECDFKHIMQNASAQLGNNMALRLEPYDMSKLRPFRSEYLSGFYADRFDRGTENTDDNSISRAAFYFGEEIVKKVKTREVIQQDPRAEIKGCDYALLPAWFLTFRINNQPYTVLINGQTGKVFSALPTDYGKMNKERWFKRLTIMPAVFVASMLVTWLGVSMVPKDGVLSVIVVTTVFFLLSAEILGGAILWAMASINYREYQRNTALTISQQNNRFVGERQGRV